MRPEALQVATPHVTVPTLTVDVEGWCCGGAYDIPADMRVTLTDEGDTAIARAEDAGGEVFSSVTLDKEQAAQFVELIAAEGATGVPNLSRRMEWRFEDHSHLVELRNELAECAEWLQHWIQGSWDPAEPEWL